MKTHIRANPEALDFEMSEDDISMLSSVLQTTWLGEYPDSAIPPAKSNPQDA